MSQPNLKPSKTQKIDYIDFLEEIICLNPNDSLEKMAYYISNLPDQVNSMTIKKHLQKCYENGHLGSVKDHLNTSLTTIDSLIKVFEGTNDVGSVDKASVLKNNIIVILDIVSEVIRDNAAQKQQDSNNKTYLDSYEAKIKEINDSIDKLERKVNDQADTMNDKLFSLILNTIAILGIFVAVAFAGFSAVSIFSELNLETTKENLLSNTFYLFLVSTLVYNLLFALLYFLFRIVQKASDIEKSFKKEMDWFLIIDGSLFALTIILFACALKFG